MNLDKIPFKSFDEAKSFIESIAQDRKQESKNSTSFANTLESNIKTIFNSAHKYVYELLQNADDAGATDVEFEIKNGHLRVTHNGSHFLRCDIDKICDNAKPSSNKSDEMTKTGYKGVGFKATFCISETIVIVSDFSSFRFDKSYCDYLPKKHAGSKFPWAIIPFWTDEHYLNQTGFNELEKTKVNFILQNIKTEKVKKELLDIFVSFEVLLLLRNVSKVTLRHEGIELLRTVNSNNAVLRQIIRGQLQHEKHYLLFKKKITIPDLNKEKLSTLSPSECPEKLKTTDEVLITFAVELDQYKQPIASKNAKLFSYLPTDIQSSLPFWVNAEFLLKQDRGSLLNVDWNNFLLREISKGQFNVLKSIAESTEMKQQVISLVPPEKMANAQLNDFKYSYDEGFSEGAAGIEFIPALDGKLLKLSECFLDKYNFFAENGGFFASPETKAQFPELFIGERNFIVDHSLHHKDKLIPFCQKRVFTLDHLLEKLEAYINIIYPNNKTAFKKLLSFLAKLNDHQLAEKLNQCKWLPLINGALQVPRKCFLSNQGNNPFAAQFALDLLDETVLPEEPAEKQLVENWLLTNLGAARINPVDIIRIHFFKLIEENRINEQLSIQMLSFIRHTYITNTENLNVISILNDIGTIFPIYIQGKIIRLNQCLMPDDLLEQQQVSPLQQIQDKIPGSYYQANTLQEKKLHSKFFLCLGVKTKLYFIPYTSAICAKSVPAIRPYLAQYIQHIRTTYEGGANFFGVEKHTITNLVICDFIDKIHLPGYQDIFWENLLAQEQIIFNCTYYTPNANTKNHRITSFIEYYLQNVPCINARNNLNLYTTNQIFSPIFAKEFPAFPYVISNIPESIPEKTLKRLGFRTELNLSECLHLLKLEQYCKSPIYLKKIYQAILIAYQNSSTHEKMQFAQLIENICILSTSGKLVAINKLTLYNECNNVPISDLFFEPCQLSPKKLSDIAAIFKLKPFSNQANLSDLEITRLEDPDEEERIRLALLIMILEFLHIATLITAQNLGLQEESKIIGLAKDYLEKLINLKLCCCDQLNYSFEKTLNLDDSISSDKTEKVYKKDDIIFFTDEAASDPISTKLINIIADELFSDEPLKSLFKEYMMNPIRVRLTKLKLPTYYTNHDLVKSLEQFFNREKSTLIIRKPLLTNTSNPPASLNNLLAGLDQHSSFSEGANHLTAPPLPLSANVSTTVDTSGIFSPSKQDNINMPAQTQQASTPANKLPLSKEKSPNSGQRNPQGTYSSLFPPVIKGGSNIGHASRAHYEETGRKGENFFYHYLLQQARTKFPGVLLTEDEIGFNLRNAQNQIFLQVNWLNKIIEQKQRRDIVVNYQGKDYIFEVKTTTGTDMHALISSAEVSEMNDKKEKYALVFVTDVNNKPQHFIQWNPHRKVAQGILQLIPVTYQIYSSAQAATTTVNENDVGPEQPTEVSHCLTQ